jgi:16S rRNA (cytosine1402-N4)-methyltransferase
MHIPVLYDAVLQGLAIKPDGIYIDGTFGRGGHSQGILTHLGSIGRLLAFDKDPDAVAWGRQHIKDPRFSLVPGSFTQLQTVAQAQDYAGRVAGILLDLGVSSPQLDNPGRGFSFLREGPLDMRMDPTRGISAATWIQTASERQIADVLWEYGEERFAKRIARALVKQRMQHAIETTKQLAEVIAAAHPAWERGKHPATQSFQAIRIFLNEELVELPAVLQQALTVLAPGGRLAVISFHSLEDRIVKRFMRKYARGNEFPRDLPIQHEQIDASVRTLGRAIRADAAEIKDNPRARSAVLRLLEKIK